MAAVRIAVALVFVSLVSIAASFPQDLGVGKATGALAGSVRTRDGLGVPQAVFVLRGPTIGIRVMAGPEGRYRVSGLSAGEHCLEADATGFVQTGRACAVVGDGETRLDLDLAPAPVREQLVVAATRGEAPLFAIGVAADVLDEARLVERRASSLLDLLQEVPGVSVARSGGVGAQGTVFVRGGASNATRILLDGVPLNEPGGAYDVGQILPLELERVEVVRGAASSLYGSDALGGVIQLVTRRAPDAAEPAWRALLEAGSHAWAQGEAGTSGRAGALDWNLGLARTRAEDGRPNSRFEQTAWASSLGARAGARTELRLVLRGSDGLSGTPGPTAFGRPDLDASYSRDERVVALGLRHDRGAAQHEIRFSHSSLEGLSRNPEDSGSYLPSYGGSDAGFPVSDFPDPAGYQNASERTLLGWQSDLQLGNRHLLSAGVDAEHEAGAIGSRAGELLRPTRDNLGGFAQGRVLLASATFLTLGGRVEQNGSYGTRAVPRAALAVRVRGGRDATTLRASAGGGIKEPSFLESYGVSFYAQGNPDLRPERSRTFDLGLDQWLLGGRLRARASLFHHDYYEQITYQVLDPSTFAGGFANLGRSRARGIELAFEAVPAAGLRCFGAYTFTDGEVLASGDVFDPVLAAGQPLLRRPRHAGSLSGSLDRGRVSVGATLLLVGPRADSDFLGLGLTENPGHARFDARARLALGWGLEAHLVVENVFDASYAATLGYPAAGRTARAGLRFRSDAGRR